MNEIYEKNLNALKKRDNELYRLVVSSENKKYKYVNNLDGTSNVYRYEHDDFVYDFSESDKQVISEIQQLTTTNMQLAFLFGIGFGYELKAVIENIIPKYKTKYLVIIEPEVEKLISVMSSADITSLINEEKVCFLVGQREEDIRLELVKMFRNSELLYYARSLDIVHSGPTYALNDTYYKNVAKIIKDVVVLSLTEIGNDPNDSLIGLKNMFYNFEEIYNNPGIINLKNKFKNKPALIVSTGPSLNKNIHLIKKIRDKVVIICPDASLKILLNHGIKPHIVTSLERTTGTLKFFQELKRNDVEDVYLAACPVIDPILYDTYKGPRLIIYRNFDHFKWLELNKGLMHIKSSSGNMAFKVAEYIGCNKIVLVGQDLALSEDGNTHAKGMVLGEKSNKHYERGIFEVKGNYQEKVLTSGILYPFLRQFESDIAEYEGRCINATEGGAFIYGAELSTLNEVINKELNEEFDSVKIIEESTLGFNDNEKNISIPELKMKTKRSIEYMYSVLEKYKHSREYILDNNEQIMKWIDSGIDNEKVYNDFYEKLRVLKSNMIMENQEYYQHLVAHIVQSYYMHFHINEVWVYGDINHNLEDELSWILKYNELFERMVSFIQIIIEQLELFGNKLENISE